MRENISGSIALAASVATVALVAFYKAPESDTVRM